jgi:hypothetical protein
MRLVSRCTVLLLFVVLGTSGSGVVLASAICSPSTDESRRVDNPQDHDCCPSGDSQHGAHCYTNSDRISRKSFETHPNEVSVVKAISSNPTCHAVPACGHCMLRSDPVLVFVNFREKRGVRCVADAEPLSSSFELDTHLDSFKLPIVHRQGAPPFASPHRYILFNIFLI